MRIDVKDERKIVSIWLSSEEKNDPAIKQSLKSIYKEFKEKKYTVAVFKSGDRDLAEYTSDLVCYNRKKMAKIEAQEEREQGFGLTMAF